MPKKLTGINIQWPISEDIISGKKTIETRTYLLPEKYKNVEMYLIETPGPKGNFKSRIIGIIKFTNCIKYKNKKEFYLDTEKHLVDSSSPWAWKDKPKYGWEVQVIRKLKAKEFSKRKGIVYTREVVY